MTIMSIPELRIPKTCTTNLLQEDLECKSFTSLSCTHVRCVCLKPEAATFLKAHVCICLAVGSEGYYDIIIQVKHTCRHTHKTARRVRPCHSIKDGRA